jgi:hypothetical protein
MITLIQIALNVLFSVLFVESVVAMRWEVLALAVFAYAIAEAHFRVHVKQRGEK